jgi:iron-sulfur cluster assembly protein
MDTTNAVTQTPVITLSESALKEVKRLINVQGLTEGGLRLGVKGGGCSGLSYTINFDEKIGPHDQIQDFDGVKVIVFKFVNPNADKTCGCGESFSA